MNENLGFITSGGGDIGVVITKIERIKTLLDLASQNMFNNFKGLSHNKYEALKGTYLGRCDQKIEELSEVVELLGLVRDHNHKRIERDALMAEIESLRGETHKEYDEDGNPYDVLNPGVMEKIIQRQNRIKEINVEMDILIDRIRGITGG